MNDGNSNLACPYCNNCDCFCRMEAFKIRSLDSAHYYPYCSDAYWIGLCNRIVFSDHINHHHLKERIKNMKETPMDVDAYIAAAPKQVQGMLKELRDTIRKIAPDADERISYGMPYYGYKGRLVYFAVHKKHIGLYVPPPVIAEHKNDLKGYETTQATVRFPIDKPLPLELVTKLIKARMKKNEMKNR